MSDWTAYRLTSASVKKLNIQSNNFINIPVLTRAVDDIYFIHNSPVIVELFIITNFTYIAWHVNMDTTDTITIVLQFICDQCSFTFINKCVKCLAIARHRWQSAIVDLRLTCSLPLSMKIVTTLRFFLTSTQITVFLVSYMGNCVLHAVLWPKIRHRTDRVKSQLITVNHNSIIYGSN